MTSRTRSLCPISDKCGGCDCLHIDYAAQLERKQAEIGSLFSDLVSDGGSSDVLRRIKGMEEPYHYRDKVISPFVYGKKTPSGKRQILTGMYEAGTHRVLPNEGCLMENEVAQRVIRAIRQIMLKYDMQPYDEDRGCGFIRHAVVRVGHETDEVLVTIVTNGREFPHSKSFCKKLIDKVSEITTIVQNVNMRQTNVILGEEERVLYGPGFILDTLCDLSFRISSKSFYQVNSKQTEVLYRSAMELARPEDGGVLIDTYCGTGTIGLVAASMGVDRVVGVDSVPSAIRDARMNALHNGIGNAEFVCADATDFMRDLSEGELSASFCDAGQSKLHGTGFHPIPTMYSSYHPERRPQASEAEGSFCDADSDGDAAVSGGDDAPVCHPERSEGSFCSTRRSSDASDITILMDPPRAGSTEEFLDAAIALRPKRIVYVSCNPKTQARDARRLVDSGFRIEAIQPIDMFPNTKHIENIVSFSAG